MVQELLQHAMLDRGQPLESEVEALCQPLLSRIVPAYLQGSITHAEGRALMVLSHTLVFCVQHAGVCTGILLTRCTACQLLPVA